MATSRPAKADGRADMAEGKIRKALADGNPHLALNLAILALQSAASKLRDYHSANGAYTDADLAGSLFAIASQLRFDHQPARPPGCPRVPRPADLTRAFDHAVDEALAAQEQTNVA